MSPASNKPQSPFLSISSFPAEESDIVTKQETPSVWYEVESPFQSIYRLEESEIVLNPEADEVISFLTELYDQEFDEAILELVNEVGSLYETQFDSELGMSGKQTFEAERMLEEHIAPLSREMEALLEDLVANIATRDVHTLAEAEIDMFVDQYVPTTNLSPNFENFFGSWKKKLKKLAKKGLGLVKNGLRAAAKLGLGPILKKLKRFIKPLLKEVLKKAIRKLPSYLQPVARGLAKRYLGRYLREIETEQLIDAGEDAIGNVTEIQELFDQEVAQLLFATDEVEQDTLLAEVTAQSQLPIVEPLRELEYARAKFVREVGQLEEGEDSTQLLENFLPALLPVLKVGLKLAGRKRVVNFLAKYLAKLIKRFVGRKYARPLSRAVVDLGLKYFGLEATEDEALYAAGEVVAYTVEETVRKLAALPDYVFEDESLLEGEILKAFEASAAAYLPPILPQAVYEERPDLREATTVEGFWMGLPIRGRKRYRKFTGKLPALKLNPHTTGAIKTWRGQPLSTHLRTRLGLPVGRRLEARVHLYETMPGTSLHEISKLERNVPGLGTGAKSAWSQLHPLTQEAAGLLIGEPGLGREVSAKYRNDPSLSPAVGQRFYFLEITGANSQLAAPGGTSIARRHDEVNVTIDFPANTIRIFIFISEAKAQEVAIRLRQQTPIGTVMTMLKSVYEANIKAALSGKMYRRVRVAHSAIAPEKSDGQALMWLPQVIIEKLEEKLLEWLGRGLSERVQQMARGFVAATEADADGVTIAVAIDNPSGLPKIRRVLAGEPVVLRSKWFSEDNPDAKIQIAPGYQREK